LRQLWKQIVPSPETGRHPEQEQAKDKQEEEYAGHPVQGRREGHRDALASACTKKNIRGKSNEILDLKGQFHQIWGFLNRYT
jgi:hypothetical protein